MATPLYQAGLLQTKAYRILQTRIAAGLQRHGINHSQWIMLSLVHASKEGVQLNAMADLLGVKAPLVTVMANELIGLGHIERVVRQSNRRAKKLIITATGSTLLEQTQEEVTAVLDGLLAGVSRRDLEAYQRVLQAINDNEQRVEA